MYAAGYTSRQADFLAHVACHGGYFLRRQYTAFIGGGHGLAVVRFLDRLVARHHACTMHFGRHGHVYHLSTPSLYTSSSLARGRSGRAASCRRVLRMLMTLDFALAHRQAEFYVTHEDKSELLAQACLPEADWPCRRHNPADARAHVTTRPLAESQPWYREGDDARLWIVYVEIHSTLTGFESFLFQHRGLLHGVTSGVAYVSRSMASGRVHDLFSRVLAGRTRDRLVNRDDFLHFCRVRRAAEIHDLRAISVPDIDRFRRLRPRFSTSRYDDLYRRWVKDPDMPSLKPGVHTSVSAECVLRPHHLQHSYGNVRDWSSF
jgi:hypothetical protein